MPMGPQVLRFVTHFDVGKADLDRLVTAATEILGGLSRRPGQTLAHGERSLRAPRSAGGLSCARRFLPDPTQR